MRTGNAQAEATRERVLTEEGRREAEAEAEAVAVVEMEVRGAPVATGGTEQSPAGESVGLTDPCCTPAQGCQACSKGSGQSYRGTEPHQSHPHTNATKRTTPRDTCIMMHIHMHACNIYT